MRDPASLSDADQAGIIFSLVNGSASKKAALESCRSTSVLMRSLFIVRTLPSVKFGLQLGRPTGYS